MFSLPVHPATLAGDIAVSIVIIFQKLPVEFFLLGRVKAQSIRKL